MFRAQVCSWIHVEEYPFPPFQPLVTCIVRTSHGIIRFQLLKVPSFVGMDLQRMFLIVEREMLLLMLLRNVGASELPILVKSNDGLNNCR